MLLEFTDSYGRSTDRGIEVTLPLSREGLANYLGMARETMSRKLNQLEAEGIIHFVDNRLMLVKDRQMLLDLSVMGDQT
jgi:CRP/FNR family transcriptional regulator